MPDNRLGSWDRQFEEGLPDCRLRWEDRQHAKHQVGNMIWDIVFCANCGEPHGAVPPDVAHVFYICDPCFEKSGTPPGCVEIKQ